MSHLTRRTAVLLALAAASPAPRADEGMWSFDNFPRDAVAKKYGFEPSDAWLDEVRLSSARLAQGCSGSFVSPQGLVMTNHHCAHACIEQLSTRKRDLVRAGFLARTLADEAKCPDLEVNQLVGIADVTARMNRATEGLEGQRYLDAERGEMARIEGECQTSAALRCEVVRLYHGGIYDLYRYRRFQDVRLVFAPEFAAAFFGGDPDNFEFPRYDLDVSFLRVYEGGKPVRMDHWFRWSAAGPRDGELTFVSGHPGTTKRLRTLAELAYQRDVFIPEALLDLAELRGILTEYQHRGPEQKRHSTAALFYCENSLKALRGRLQTLKSPKFWAAKSTEEQALKERLGASPERQALPAFDAIAEAEARFERFQVPLRHVEMAGAGSGSSHEEVAVGAGFAGKLFRIARVLVRGAEELQKPLEPRLREFRDSALPEVTQDLFSTAPIHAEFEMLRLGHSLAKLRERLGPDHPLVRKVLGRLSPEELATRLVRGTKLADPALRRRLWQGGKAAVEASPDPMIALARSIDAEGRALRQRYQDEVESALERSGEAIARARFRLEGTKNYPDATFTLRLSYGQVKSYTREDGVRVEPFTTFAGAYERATGRPPFDLPPSWLKAKDRLDLATPLDLASDNDIIGGNSGSPVVNQRAEIVGLVFDGNIESLGGDYWFDPAVNRTVSVTSAALREALDKIYGARRILHEIDVPPEAPQGSASQGAPSGG